MRTDSDPAFAQQSGLHVLTITPFYPTEKNDAFGCFVAEPLRFLSRLGIRQTVFAVQPFYRVSARVHPNGITARALRFLSLPYGFGLPSSGAFLFSRIIGEVRRLHAVDPIHLIHAHSALPCGHAGTLLSRALGLPLVVTVHGLDAYANNQVRGAAARWCERVCQMVYRDACRVVCVSEAVRNEIEKYASAPTSTVVVYNGVDTDLFAPNQAGDQKLSVLSIGNLIPSKGHELLIRALGAIQEFFPEVVCEIVGEGPDLERLRVAAAECEMAVKVCFLGRQTRTRVAEALQRCTVFALPSSYEGLGCVYLEAMASERPAIGCSAQGISEIIEKGRNGWLIDPGDGRQLAEALKTLLGDAQLRRDIGRAARKTVVEAFTLQHQAAALHEVYRECVQ